jgi:hypothetical protein
VWPSGDLQGITRRDGSWRCCSFILSGFWRSFTWFGFRGIGILGSFHSTGHETHIEDQIDSTCQSFSGPGYYLMFKGPRIRSFKGSGRVGTERHPKHKWSVIADVAEGFQIDYGEVQKVFQQLDGQGFVKGATVRERNMLVYGKENAIYGVTNCHESLVMTLGLEMGKQ